jgi:hypothetical protein
MNPEEAIRAVKRRYAPQFLQKPGVSGIGVEKDDTGRYVLAIHVDGSNAALVDQLPKEIEGHPVRVVQSGPFRALAE